MVLRSQSVGEQDVADQQGAFFSRAGPGRAPFSCARGATRRYFQLTAPFERVIDSFVESIHRFIDHYIRCPSFTLCSCKSI